MIAKQKGNTEIYHNLALDWSLPYTPKITAKDFQFGIKGLFFDRLQPEVEPVTKPPTNMPMIDTSEAAKFQAYVSTYLLESLSSSFLKTNEIHIWTHSNVIPKKFPIQLNTSSLFRFIPGLVAKYGENKAIDLEFKL